jgi:hypothetical protein
MPIMRATFVLGALMSMGSRWWLVNIVGTNVNLQHDGVG